MVIGLKKHTKGILMFRYQILGNCFSRSYVLKLVKSELCPMSEVKVILPSRKPNSAAKHFATMRRTYLIGTYRLICSRISLMSLLRDKLTLIPGFKENYDQQNRH